jgi:hypothetical protein
LKKFVLRMPRARENKAHGDEIVRNILEQLQAPSNKGQISGAAQ